MNLVRFPFAFAGRNLAFAGSLVTVDAPHTWLDPRVRLP